MPQYHHTLLAIAVATNTPVILWGEPGIGKTATIAAIARSLRLPLETVIASIHEPSDFSGLPIPTGDEVTFAPPSWAVRLAREGKGILFLDEISTAPPAVQAALLRVVLEKTIGQFRLPDSVRIIAAANPPELAAGGFELAPPLANRFVHLEWPAPSSGDWVSGFLQGFPDPIVPEEIPWQEQLPLAQGLIAAFLTSRPELLCRIPQDPSQAGKAFPTPRSWAMAARMLAGALAINPTDEGLIALAVGSAVGQGVGIELAALVGGDVLLDPKEALSNPDHVHLPERDDKLLVLLSAATAHVASHLDSPTFPDLWEAAWKLLARSAREKAPDVAAVAVRPLYQIFRQSLSQGRFLKVNPSYIEPFSELLKEAK